MKKLYFISLIFLLAVSVATGQKYYSKNASIHFSSDAPLEKIEAKNNSAYVVFDANTGQMEWAVLIKGFKFEKALMQQHFNENYMDSDKYPKATFKGLITDPDGINLSKDGTYNVNVAGQLNIRGISKPVNAPGRLIVKDGNISTESSFNILISDYGISVPKVVRENIASTVKVTVNAHLQP